MSVPQLNQPNSLPSVLPSSGKLVVVSSGDGDAAYTDFHRWHLDRLSESGVAILDLIGKPIGLQEKQHLAVELFQLFGVDYTLESNGEVFLTRQAKIVWEAMIDENWSAVRYLDVMKIFQRGTKYPNNWMPHDFLRTTVERFYSREWMLKTIGDSSEDLECYTLGDSPVQLWRKTTRLALALPAEFKALYKAKPIQMNGATGNFAITMAKERLSPVHSPNEITIRAWREQLQTEYSVISREALMATFETSLGMLNTSSNPMVTFLADRRTLGQSSGTTPATQSVYAFSEEDDLPIANAQFSMGVGGGRSSAVLRGIGAMSRRILEEWERRLR